MRAVTVLPPPRRPTIARKFGRKPLKRLILRPGQLPPPYGPCFATRRVAALPSMRAVTVRPPPRRPTIARKFGRKPLKRLILRPGQLPPPYGPCFATRRVAALPSIRAVTVRPPPRRPTIARKFGRKPLKRLILRPGQLPPPYGPCFGTRRVAPLPSMRAERVRMSTRPTTVARRFRRKPLKTLNPRPGFGWLGVPAGEDMKRLSLAEARRAVDEAAGRVAAIEPSAATIAQTARPAGTFAPCRSACAAGPRSGTGSCAGS